MIILKFLILFLPVGFFSYIFGLFFTDAIKHDKENGEKLDLFISWLYLIGTVIIPIIATFFLLIKII